VDLPRWEEIPEFARLLVVRRLAVLLFRRAADQPGSSAGVTLVVAGGERDEFPGVGPQAGKVTAEHCDRLAVMYVRQSTLRQVHENTESAKMQYALVERAAGLGWVPSRIVVIDEDMGHSAGGRQDGPRFTPLVSEVGLGHVGVVIGIEMSRLARSGRDWHQLLELCALSRTLLAGPDGVYDPADHNDRLLLGLKGTISEAELYLIKSRMWGGRLAKAQRGELGIDPPAGYVRRPGGGIVGADTVGRDSRGYDAGKSTAVSGSLSPTPLACWSWSA
jgi:DNA invertase Pin-like site-specific DNA recombinase